MTQIPPEYQPMIARVAEKLARATPGMAPHLDDSADVDALFSFQCDPHRQDAGVDDITAINLKIQQQD